MTVYPDSPAQAAGFEVGDIVLGPVGAPFTEKNQIREWTMLSRVDAPAPLVVRREARELQLTLVPKPSPLKWPALPGPPKPGTPAPPLVLGAYRGTPPPSLATGTPHLLFFWATWCAPCKAALPELLAYADATRTTVVAITDEPADQLAPFFKSFDKPFPATVAIDELRKAFLAYGVNGTPTFVLVDGTGKVQHAATGYNAKKGLGIDGWTWAHRDGAPARP
jgi:thiol-disulfide isomerase/thioredoxin